MNTCMVVGGRQVFKPNLLVEDYTVIIKLQLLFNYYYNYNYYNIIIIITIITTIITTIMMKLWRLKNSHP